MSSTATTPTADPTITPPVGPTSIGPDTQDPNKDPNSLEYRSAANVVSRLSGRLWDAIKEGIPAFNSKFEAAAHTDTGTLANGETPKEQLITPEAAMTPKERKAHPILTGVGESLGSFTSPENAIIMAGTGGFGELPGAAGKLIPKLLSLKFSADAIKGAYAQIPDFKAAMDRGDESEAERIIAHIVIDTAVGADVGQHATEGVMGEGLAKANTGRTFTKGTDTISPKISPIELSNQVESAAAPALAKPAPVDLSSVGGVPVERRAPGSPFRTPGTAMKKVADQSYAAMREHGIDTTPAPVETKLEEPSGKFAPVGGVEQRAATTFGRTGGSFGRTVDQTYDVLRAQEKPAVEVSNQVESNAGGDVYKNGGWVLPDGAERPFKFEGSDAQDHEELARDIGLGDDLEEALNTGAKRISVWTKAGKPSMTSVESMRMGDADQSLTRDAILHARPDLPVLVEWHEPQHGYEEFKNKEEAVDWLDNGARPRRSISNQVESNVAAPAIHPDLQKLSDKYGVSDDPEKVRNGASFIRPDGQFIHLPAGMEHPTAIERVTGERPEEDLKSLGDKMVNSNGPEDSRVRFLADTGAVRTRFHMGRGGQTLSVSVPEKGVTPEQIQALKDGFRTSMDGGRGNLVMEIGTPDGKSTQADYVTANEIEPALARIGAMPNQRVNLSDAYGDTGAYIGGHVPLQAGKDFPGNFEKDNFTSRRTTGNNMFDPEGFITGEEMAKGMTPANSHREFPSEEDYQNTVHSRGVNVDDVAKKYPRVFNDPAMANMAESRIDKVNWDAQAKGAPKGVTNRQVWNENIGVTHGPDLLEVPKNRIGPNQTTPTVLHHEIGHIIAAHQEGLPTDESFIGSHLSTHSQDTGGAAYTNFDFSRLPGAKKVGGGVTFSPDDLAKAFPTLIHIMLGGGAMEDILDGVPWQKNEGLAGDLRQIRGIGKALGLSPDEVEAKISKQMDVTKSRLNTSEILDIVRNASATREEGLSKTLHMSKERVQRDIIQKLNEVTSGKRTDDTSTSAGDTAGTVRGADQGIGEAASSREGQVSGGVARGDEPAAVQGSLFSDASPKMKKVVEDTPWEKDEDHDGYRKLMVSDAGKEVGQLRYSDSGDGIARVRVSGIKPEYRDQGIAKEMYKSAIEDAKKQGFKVLTSDQTVSRDARRVWDSLAKDGQYSIETIHKKGFNPNGGGITYRVDLTKPAEIKNTVESSKAVAAKEDEPYDKIVDIHNQNGGSTWNLAQNKSLSGTDNYAVSTHPDRTLPVKGELTPEIVKSFAEKNADLLKDPTESLGTWNDKANNQHVLDVVKTIPDRAEAVRLGFENKQDAIYDLKKTDGTGEIRMEDEKPDIYTTAGAQGIADRIGAKVVGSVAEKGVSRHDLDLRVNDYDQPKIEAAMKAEGFEPLGSSIVSPDEAKQAGKSFDTEGGNWARAYHFQSISEPRQKIDVWHSEPPLPEDYQAKVAAIRQTHGDDAAFNELAQTLPAKERAAVGKVMRRNILDAFAELPQGIEEDATEAAKAGAIQKGWYRHTATLIKSIFGGDTKLFSNILASLSPMMGVRENFIAALKFYADWHAAGRPTSGKALDALTTNKFMKIHALNLIRSVNGEDITGPKVSQFAKNVRGHLDAITNDRWMQFFTGNPKAWSKSKMAASDIVVRRVAQKLGWKPAEVQETIWSFVKPVVELSEKEGVSPSEKAKTITDTEVREGAGSFANLLSDPVVREAFGKIADATGDERFRPSRIEGSRSFKRVQKSTPTPTGKPVGGPADVLGRVGERTAATRTKYLNKGIAKLGEERQPGED